MPTYDYECTRCGHGFEKFQSISAPVLKRCPSCRGKLRRLIGTGSGLLFKGSGFYSTDYRSKGYEQARKNEEKPQSSSDSKPSGSKPDKSSESSSPSGKK